MSAEFVIHEEHFTKKNSLEKKFGLDDVNKKKEVIVYCPTVPSLGVTKYPPFLKKKKRFELFQPQVRKNTAIVSRRKCQVSFHLKSAGKLDNNSCVSSLIIISVILCFILIGS